MTSQELDTRLSEMSETLSTAIIEYMDLGVAHVARSYAAKVLEDSMPIVWHLFMVDDRILAETSEYEIFRECKKMIWYQDLMEASELLSWGIRNEAAIAFKIYTRMCRSEEVDHSEVEFLLRFLLSIDEAIFDYIQKSANLEMEFRELVESLTPPELPIIEVMTERKRRWRRFTVSSNKPPFRPLSAEMAVRKQAKVGLNGIVLHKLLNSEPEVWKVSVTPTFVQVRLYNEEDWASFEPRVFDILRAVLNFQPEQLRVRER